MVKAGEGRLLALPYPPRSGWRDIIFGSQSSSLSIPDGSHGYTLEVLADVRSYVEALGDYLMSAAVAFLVSVILAGLAQLLVVRAVVGYWPPSPAAGLALLAAETVVLLTLALLLSSVVSPMASGIISVVFFQI